MSEAIGSALSSIISLELQMQFSGCGKPTKGVAKENLSSTELFKILTGNTKYNIENFMYLFNLLTIFFTDCLLKQFSSESEKTVLSKTSRWLSSAKDRSGGRYSR